MRVFAGLSSEYLALVTLCVLDKRNCTSREAYLAISQYTFWRPVFHE
jgi:hypothetical protein